MQRYLVLDRTPVFQNLNALTASTLSWQSVAAHSSIVYFDTFELAKEHIQNATSINNKEFIIAEIICEVSAKYKPELDFKYIKKD